MLRKEFSHLRSLPSLWSPSKFISSCGAVTLEVVNRGSETLMQIRKYRLYPTREQVLKLEETLETCRKTWNYLLSKRKIGRVSKFDQDHDIFVQKQKNPFLKAVYSHVLQNVADKTRQVISFILQRCCSCSEVQVLSVVTTLSLIQMLTTVLSNLVLRLVRRKSTCRKSVSPDYRSQRCFYRKE